MKHLLFTLCLSTLMSFFLSATVHGQTDEQYTIRCQMGHHDADGNMIYLTDFDTGKNIDSTLVRDASFCFEGHTAVKRLCRIDVSPTEYAVLVLEGGNIKVGVDASKNESVHPSGTLLNNVFSQLSSQADTLSNDTARYALCHRLMQQHGNDPIGLYLLFSEFSFDMPPHECLQMMEGCGPWLKAQNMYKIKLAMVKGLMNTEEDSMFADVPLTDADGHAVKLSQYVGKGRWVLMDVWASWCGPCREEMPCLARVKDVCRDKELDVIGVFTNDESTNLKKAVNELHINWLQLIDSEQAVMPTYGIDGIPYIILFAPDGTIAKRDLRGNAMVEYVQRAVCRPAISR